MIPPPFTPEMLAAVEHLVVGAGGFARELIAHTAGSSELKDDHGQRVSAADRLIDRLLRERLVELVPGSGSYSEEGGFYGAPLSEASVFWLIDPLDGTRPALLGGAYAISVGALLRDAGRPVGALGWVYVPNLPCLYRAVITAQGAAVTRNGLAAAAIPPESANLRNGFMAVSSDWPRRNVPMGPFKLTAPGATAVHLTQLVHAGSDVAAVCLTRYFPHDAAAGLPIAVAGGCEIFPYGPDGLPGDPAPLLPFLAQLAADPESYGPPILVATRAVRDHLAGSTL